MVDGERQTAAPPPLAIVGAPKTQKPKWEALLGRTYRQFATITLHRILVASLLLAAGLALHQTGLHGLAVANEELKRVAEAEQKLAALRAAVVKYERAVAVIGLRTGTQMRRDPVTIAASLAEGESVMLPQILSATYEEEGTFLMTSFDLNTGGGTTLGVNFQGQKLVTYPLE